MDYSKISYASVLQVSLHACNLLEVALQLRVNEHFFYYEDFPPKIFKCSDINCLKTLIISESGRVRYAKEVSRLVNEHPCLYRSVEIVPPTPISAFFHLTLTVAGQM